MSPIGATRPTVGLLATPARRAIAGLGLVLVASTSVQTSALLAHGLFDRLGPFGVSGLRFAIAAVVLCAIVRPRLRGRTPRAWASIGCFGLAIAAMNLFLYASLAHLPFGVALTIEFLGPFAVAALGVRRPRQAVFPFLGLVGVALIARPSFDVDPLGLLLAGLAAAALGGYTVLAERVGGEGAGVAGLALALVVAATATSPFAVAALPSARPGDAMPLIASAVIGVVIAFTADFLAVRLTSARTVSVLLSFDPVLAAVLGALVLGDRVDPVTAVGIVLVAAAGGCTTWAVGRAASDRRTWTDRRAGGRRRSAPRPGSRGPETGAGASARRAPVPTPAGERAQSTAGR